MNNIGLFKSMVCYLALAWHFEAIADWRKVVRKRLLTTHKWLRFISQCMAKYNVGTHCRWGYVGIPFYEMEIYIT